MGSPSRQLEQGKWARLHGNKSESNGIVTINGAKEMGSTSQQPKRKKWIRLLVGSQSERNGLAFTATRAQTERQPTVPWTANIWRFCGGDDALRTGSRLHLCARELSGASPGARAVSSGMHTHSIGFVRCTRKSVELSPGPFLSVPSLTDACQFAAFLIGPLPNRPTGVRPDVRGTM